MRSDWAPLQQILGPKLRAQFMYMGRSGKLYLYKHIFTRRYLNLDAEGNCFRYTGNGYEPEEFRRAIEDAFG